MNVPEMRNAISKVYLGRDWQRKVRDMCDGQVIAVYHSFIFRGLLSDKPKEKKPDMSWQFKTTYDFKNLPSIDEYLKENQSEQLTIFKD